MNLKNFNLIILTIVMIMAVSGCNKKTVNEVKNNDIDNKASTTGEVKTDVKDAEITEEAPEITSDIDTSDWQTYQNEEYGFEVKYPKNWKHLITENGFIELKDIEKKVYFEEGEAYLIGISVLNFSNIDETNKYRLTWENNKIKDGWVKNLKINDLEVAQGYNFFGLETIIIAKDGKKIIKISKGTFSPEYDLLDEIYNALIASCVFY